MKAKIIAFDFDGVISSVPIRVSGLMKISYFLMVVPQLRFIYDRFFRKVDREVNAFLKALKRKGIKIFIITANSKGYEKELRIWLEKNGIFYDQLYCYQSNCGLTVGEWKAKMAKKVQADYFIEDFPRIADVLRSYQIKVILYNGRNADELWQLI